MREEMKGNELSQVNGGKVYVNTRTKKVGFNHISGAFTIKNVSPYDVLELCDSMIGQYATDEEYDQACYDELKSRGWI